MAPKLAAERDLRRVAFDASGLEAWDSSAVGIVMRAAYRQVYETTSGLVRIKF